MKVEHLGTTVPSHTKFGFKKVNKSVERSFDDQLKLSKEAVKMSSEISQNRDSYLNEIKDRVKNGYYDQTNILDKVAESIIDKDEIVSS